MDDWKCDNFAIVSNTVLKKLQMTRPGARIEIVSTKFGTGKNQMASGAMGTLVTYNVVAKVDESCETHHLVYKKMVEKEGFFRDVAAYSQFYQKEIGMYKELIPFINKFQIDVGVTPIPLAVPEFYGGTLAQDYSFLIMQNIGASGFKNADHKYLGYDEVMVCVTEIAKIHALGHALISEYDQEQLFESFPFLRDTVCVKHTFRYSFYLWSESYEHAIDMVRSVDYELGTKMGKYHNKSYDILCQQMTRYDQHLQGLTHADLWFSNMMFKYNNNGAAIDVKFLDFQTIRLGSATTDLTYFLYSSTTRAFRNIYYREVLEAYLTSYKSTLTHIHMNISPSLTLDYLMQKMKETLPYAVVFMSFAMPMQLMDGDPKDAPEKMIEVSIKNDHSIQVPEHWKDADQHMNEKSKSEQKNLVLNLAHIMYSSNNVKERMLEFYTEMSHFGVI